MTVKLESSVLLVSASLYCRSCGKLTQSYISFEEDPFHLNKSFQRDVTFPAYILSSTETLEASGGFGVGKLKHDFCHLELSVVELRGSCECAVHYQWHLVQISWSLWPSVSFFVNEWEGLMYLFHLTQWGFAEQPGARDTKMPGILLSRQPAFNNSSLFYWTELQLGRACHYFSHTTTYLPFLWLLLLFSCRIFLFWHAYFILPNYLNPILHQDTAHIFPLWTILLHKTRLDLSPYSLASL